MNLVEELKVVVLGDKSVGKSSLVIRYVEDNFSNIQRSTIGAFFLTKMVTSNEMEPIKLMIWDTAGQERFRSMSKLYYRDASACVLCFDLTDEPSYIQLQDWVEEIRNNSINDGIVLVICGNKVPPLMTYTTNIYLINLQYNKP